MVKSRHYYFFMLKFQRKYIISSIINIIFNCSITKIPPLVFSKRIFRQFLISITCDIDYTSNTPLIYKGHYYVRLKLLFFFQSNNSKCFGLKEEIKIIDFILVDSNFNKNNR